MVILAWVNIIWSTITLILGSHKRKMDFVDVAVLLIMSGLPMSLSIMYLVGR